MKIISIIGQKGGTGKTTLACALAVSSFMDGKTTVAIDLDPQVSLCEWADIRNQNTPVVIDCQPARLERVLNTTRSGGADLCLIDTAGRAEVAALTAAKVADLVVIPCQPTIPDIKKVSAALDIVRLAGKGSAPSLVVLTRVKSPLRRKEAADWLEVSFGFEYIARRIVLQHTGSYAIKFVSSEYSVCLLFTYGLDQNDIPIQCCSDLVYVFHGTNDPCR